jgi:hypothetical protein
MVSKPEYNCGADACGFTLGLRPDRFARLTASRPAGALPVDEYRAERIAPPAERDAPPGIAHTDRP